MVEYKWIRVSEAVHKALSERGNKGDSFNDIIVELLEVVKKGD